MVITDVKRIKSASSGALSKSNSGVKSTPTLFDFFFCLLTDSCWPLHTLPLLLTAHLSLRHYLQKWSDIVLAALCRPHPAAVAKKDRVAVRSQDGPAATPTFQGNARPGS